MKLKLVAALLSIILFSSVFVILPNAIESGAKADISVAMKAKKKMTLLAIKNNSDIPIYGFEIKSIDGSIRFIKTKAWDREKIDQNTVVLRTDDRPMIRGSNMIVLLILDNRVSAVEWSAFGLNENTLTSLLLNRGTIATSGGAVQREESKPTLSCSGIAACFAAIVVKIVDGDTLDVSTESSKARIRLALSNTPERGQPQYNEATQFTAILCPVGSTVIVDEDDGQREGSFGRTIGKVFCSNKILNAELLYAGLAVVDPRFCTESDFAREIWAREFGCG